MLPKGSVPGSGALIAPIGGALSPPSTVFSAEERASGSARRKFAGRNPLSLKKLANDQGRVVRFPYRGGTCGAGSHLSSIPSCLWWLDPH